MTRATSRPISSGFSSSVFGFKTSLNFGVAFGARPLLQKMLQKQGVYGTLEHVEDKLIGVPWCVARKVNSDIFDLIE